MKPITLLTLLILIMPLASAGSFFYNGYAFGACKANATVNATIYEDGFLNDPTRVIDSRLNYTLNNGKFAFLSNSIGDGTDYEINITITNGACSASSAGSVAAQNATPLIPAPIMITTNVTITSVFAPVTPGNNSVTSDNTTTFDWNGDFTNKNYTLQIDDNADFSSPVQEIFNITATTSTLVTPLVDGVFHWRIQVTNTSNEVVENGSRHVVQVASGEAAIGSPNPTNMSWAGSSQLASFSTSLAGECRYSTSSGVAYGSKTAMTTTGGTSHSHTFTLASDGQNDFYIQCNTTTGVVNAQDYHYALQRDSTPPDYSASTVSIDGGAAYSPSDTTLDFTWNAFTDTGSGVRTYYYNFTKKLR